jgi:predicted nucleic acid-binding protein
MYILDTNVVSELRKAGNGLCHPSVLTWAESVQADLLFLSVISVMELEIGCLLLARRDVRQAAVIRTWISDHVLVAFKDRILAFDHETARRCAALYVPDRRFARDAMIAATAMQRDFVIVTRNIRDFADTGARLLNPWND